VDMFWEGEKEEGGCKAGEEGGGVLIPRCQ